jgi:dihydrofolate reductase
MRGFVFVGSSLDGFIARSNGAFDFLLGEGGVDGEANGFNDFLQSMDALVMGRNTYDVCRVFEQWPYGDKPVFVLSSGAIAPAPEGVEVEHLSGEPHEIAVKLDALGIERAYVDGGDTIQRFLRAGLIDRITITRVPVLIGEGIALFGKTGFDIKLRHVATRTLPNGYVQSEYEVRAAE